MVLKRISGLFTVGILLVGLVAGCALPLPLPTGLVGQPGAEEIVPTLQPTVDPLSTVDGAGVMATIATRSLRVRSAPNDNSEVVAGVAAGESYRVVALSDNGLWVQIALEDTTADAGWVSTNFVTVEGDLTTLTAEPEEVAAPAGSGFSLTLVPTPAAGYAQVSTDGVRLRVRSGPSLANPIVGYIYDGESYPVLESSADNLWVRIPASSGNNSDNSSGGWVAAEYLILGQ